MAAFGDSDGLAWIRLDSKRVSKRVSFIDYGGRIYNHVGFRYSQ